MCVCVDAGSGGGGGGVLDEYVVCEYEHGTCKVRLTTVSHWPQKRHVRWLHLLPLFSALSLGEIESQQYVQ